MFSNDLAQESSDDDNDDEDEDKEKDEKEDVQEETRTSGEQCFGLQTFRTLGCELADISKSVLFADAPVIKLIPSAAECHRLLKVSAFPNTPVFQSLHLLWRCWSIINIDP